jgi:hypothetical protein
MDSAVVGLGLLGCGCCMELVFRGGFAFEDAIGFQACSHEASKRVANSMPLECSPPLTIRTFYDVTTPKAFEQKVKVTTLLGWRADPNAKCFLYHGFCPQLQTLSHCLDESGSKCTVCFFQQKFAAPLAFGSHATAHELCHSPLNGLNRMLQLPCFWDARKADHELCHKP